MKRRFSRARGPEGFALIAVLWFLVLTAAIGTFIVAHGRSETALARNIRAAATAEALADAGVAEAVFSRADAAAPNRWALDGKPHRIQLAGGEIAVRIFDETAKINPNRASDALLGALYQSLGVEAGRARRLGAAIADWVGEDKEPRRLGAKLPQYRAAGKTYGPPNAAIETLDELNLVLGMTPELLALSRPYLTLYTEDGEPKAADLSPVVKRALTNARRAEGETGVDAAGPDAPPPGTAQGQPQNANVPPAAPDIVTIEATARSADGGVYLRHAVVRIGASKPKGYEVLDWRRGEFAATEAALSD